MNKRKKDKDISDTTGLPGRPRQFGDRVQVVFYVERSELQDLKKVAGNVPLSTYMRDMVQKKIKDSRRKG